MESSNSAENTSLSLGHKLVPWVNWDEWNYVRRSIFSSSPKLVSAALQKISAWESSGCLPIAVDLTAIIIEIHQKDPFFKGDDSIGDALASEKMLNMLYCMFIMRLVNDFVEPVHKKTGGSISSLADEVGIPRSLVDIRHESSHRSLPSLKLVRSASLKALEWLKANYWKPQRKAIHDSRREVKTELREMILCSRYDHVPRVNSAKFKRRISTVKKFNSVKRAVHLYYLYPSEVVSLLLYLFLLQASDMSEDFEMKYSDDSKCAISKPVAGSLTNVKMIISKLCNKKPMFLLSMLKLSLEKIEEMVSMDFENDGSQVETNQLRHLRSLVFYLVSHLKALKESGRIALGEENQILSMDNIATPKFLLLNLLQKCLTLLLPGDKYIQNSVLLLSEMSGNKLIAEKLNKLPLLASLDKIHLAPVNYNESLLLKEEDSTKKATEKLNYMKQNLLNSKNGETGNTSSNSEATSRWTVTKSWVACPIGTLPCSFSSVAVLPVFDTMEIEKKTNKCDTIGHNIDIVHAVNESEAVCDGVEFCDDDNDVNMLTEMALNEGCAMPENPFPLEGRLLIDGVWKKLSEEELASLEADVRIFV